MGLSRFSATASEIEIEQQKVRTEEAFRLWKQHVNIKDGIMFNEGQLKSLSDIKVLEDDGYDDLTKS